MMGRQTGDQSQLFYLFNLEQRIPRGHLLRRINPVVTRLLADVRITPESGRRSDFGGCLTSAHQATFASERAGAFGSAASLTTSRAARHFPLEQCATPRSLTSDNWHRRRR